MEAWRDIILLASVLGIFAFGFFLTTRLDKLLDANRKAIEKENEIEEPSCVMLTGDMSDEEIAVEIRIFREKHKKSYIVLYDSADSESPGNIECHIGQKR